MYNCTFLVFLDVQECTEVAVQTCTLSEDSIQLFVHCTVFHHQAGTLYRSRLYIHIWNVHTEKTVSNLCTISVPKNVQVRKFNVHLMYTLCTQMYRKRGHIQQQKTPSLVQRVPYDADICII